MFDRTILLYLSSHILEEEFLVPKFKQHDQFRNFVYENMKRSDILILMKKQNLTCEDLQILTIREVDYRLVEDLLVKCLS